MPIKTPKENCKAEAPIQQCDWKFVNYTEHQINASSYTGSNGTGITGSGQIMDIHSTQIVVEAQQAPSIPSENEDQSICRWLVEDHCKRVKFCLYDRLEAGCLKDGEFLSIGSLRRDCFESLYSSWSGSRWIGSAKKGRGVNSWNVYICFTFNDGHAFFNEIPSKYSFVEDYEKQKKIIRQVRHRYTQLTFFYNMQNGNCHVNYTQTSEKSYENKWVKIN